MSDTNINGVTLKRRQLLVRLFRSYMGWRAYLGVIASARAAWLVSVAH